MSTPLPLHPFYPCMSLKAVTAQNSSSATGLNYRSHLKVVLGPTV